MSWLRVLHFIGLTNLSETEVQRYEALTRATVQRRSASLAGAQFNSRGTITATAGGGFSDFHAGTDRDSFDPDRRPGSVKILLMGLIFSVLLFAAYSIHTEIGETGQRVSTDVTYPLLFFALLIGLGFEFVNGFHDTANAAAMVIYTRALPFNVAVVWSGMFNLFGVLMSTGAVAFGIVSLLPVEAILQVDSSAGFAMVFSLLIAAITWNVGTWYFGLPASSSHTLIGSIMGVSFTHAMLHGRNAALSVDWSEAAGIAYALLLSPLFGFALAALLLFALKTVMRRVTPAVFAEPRGDQPPPVWIRSILILTCTLVSFFHGSNDGQKGMGLIMLILIGTVPTAYAINRALPDSQVQQFVTNSTAASNVIKAKAANDDVLGDPRPAVTSYVAEHKVDSGTYASLAVLVGDIGNLVTHYGSLAKLPAEQAGNIHSDMYLASEAIRVFVREKEGLNKDEAATLNKYKASLDSITKFIPTWVKLSVAIALGLGTMIGWKRIVVTVGEKIGKTQLTYAQGACAEVTAVVAAMVGDGRSLPLSTTYVLSSGVAGTMAASGSGLQLATVRNIALAWILTLPVTMLFSGAIYFGLSRLF
jgi:inorganic phosphate transporter, PiT family